MPKYCTVSSTQFCGSGSGLIRTFSRFRIRKKSFQIRIRAAPDLNEVEGKLPWKSDKI
jgi:hypothetical protein